MTRQTRTTKPSRIARNERRNPEQARSKLLTVRNIQPKTDAQEDFLDAFAQGFNIVGVGSAGTGKSFLSLYLALKEVESGRKQKVIIVRSAVPTREQGFLKGTLEEKEAVYELPYKDIVNDLCASGTSYESLKKHDKIQFITSSYVRGLTFDNAVIVVDEFQSMHQEELYSVLTRVGENSKVIVIGDTKQCDLNPRREESGFNWFMKVCDKMHDHFDIIEFQPQDIVRSGFVKALIMANEG